VVKHRLSAVLHVASSAAAGEVSWLGRRRALTTLVLAVATATALMTFGIHINLSTSAPRGLYRAVADTPLRGAWVAACVSTDAAALGLARGYLRPGACPGGAEAILKRVVAVGGDVVELSPDGVVVNGISMPESASASVDSSARPLPHATRGRHVLGADELWLMSTQVPNSWDSRYLGPFSTSQVRAVARPMWTVGSAAALTQPAEWTQ
jgi:conjugative transfer signal peptidase TraF